MNYLQLFQIFYNLISLSAITIYHEVIASWLSIGHTFMLLLAKFSFQDCLKIIYQIYCRIVFLHGNMEIHILRSHQNKSGPVRLALHTKFINQK